MNPGDCFDWTPAAALEKALEVAKGDNPPDAVISIMLWNEGGKYNRRTLISGLTCSDIVALLEIEKVTYINGINENPDNED